MNFLIRVDSNKKMGSGHAMRMIALAEVLVAEGHKVFFCYNQMLPEIENKIVEIGASYQFIDAEISSDQDLKLTCALVVEKEVSAIIVDGYIFNQSYLQSLGQNNVLVYMDDLASVTNSYVDIIINSSPAASNINYEKLAPNALRLIGPDFVPIRSEFREEKQRLLPLNRRENILVTFGGTDPMSLTIPTINALIGTFPSTQNIDVVVMTDKMPCFPTQIKVHNNCNYMAELMAKSRLAISAGGSTVFELAAMNVPTIIAVVADNQEKHAQWSQKNEMSMVVDLRLENSNHAADIIANAAKDLMFNFERRTKYINNNKKLVDGMGTIRIAEEIIEMCIQEQNKRED